MGGQRTDVLKLAGVRMADGPSSKHGSKMKAGAGGGQHRVTIHAGPPSFQHDDGDHDAQFDYEQTHMHGPHIRPGSETRVTYIPEQGQELDQATGDRGTRVTIEEDELPD